MIGIKVYDNKLYRYSWYDNDFSYWRSYVVELEDIWKDKNYNISSEHQDYKPIIPETIYEWNDV